MADNILGPWTEKGNPIVGDGAETTFGAQSTFVLPAPSKPPGSFIFLADRWNPEHLEDSRYVWLPFTVHDDDSIGIRFLPEWDLSDFDRLQKSPSRQPNLTRSRMVERGYRTRTRNAIRIDSAIVRLSRSSFP